MNIQLIQIRVILNHLIMIMVNHKFIYYYQKSANLKRIFQEYKNNIKKKLNN